MHPADEQRQSNNAETENNDASRLLDAVNVCADDAARLVSDGQDLRDVNLREEIRKQGHES